MVARSSNAGCSNRFSLITNQLFKKISVWLWYFEKVKRSPCIFRPQVSTSPQTSRQLSCKEIVFTVVKEDATCGTVGCGKKQNEAPCDNRTSICCEAPFFI